MPGTGAPDRPAGGRGRSERGTADGVRFHVEADRRRLLRSPWLPQGRSARCDTPYGPAASRNWVAAMIPGRGRAWGSRPRRDMKDLRRGRATESACVTRVPRECEASARRDPPRKVVCFFRASMSGGKSGRGGLLTGRQWHHHRRERSESRRHQSRSSSGATAAADGRTANWTDGHEYGARLSTLQVVERSVAHRRARSRRTGVCVEVGSGRTRVRDLLVGPRGGGWGGGGGGLSARKTLPCGRHVHQHAPSMAAITRSPPHRVCHSARDTASDTARQDAATSAQPVDSLFWARTRTTLDSAGPDGAAASTHHAGRRRRQNRRRPAPQGGPSSGPRGPACSLPGRTTTTGPAAEQPHRITEAGSPRVAGPIFAPRVETGGSHGADTSPEARRALSREAKSPLRSRPVLQAAAAPRSARLVVQAVRRRRRAAAESVSPQLLQVPASEQLTKRSFGHRDRHRRGAGNALATEA